MVSVPWWFIGLQSPAVNPLDGFLNQRLKALDIFLAKREWLAAGQFTIADILMADILRLPKVREVGDYKAIRAYVERACARPAFKKAYEAQMAHFAASKS